MLKNTAFLANLLFTFVYLSFVIKITQEKLAGLYIHIPFCKQACYYCNFYFSTNLSLKKDLVQAICREIILQKNYLPDQQIQTVYLGGGTPSLLNEKELKQIFEVIHHIFSLDKNAEITLEANPDDLDRENLQIFKKAGVNRLSIGIQSFDKAHLKYLHRIHTAEDALICVKKAQDLAFENISIDLIYGIPAENHTIWEADLQKAIALNVQHISAYCLTIEEKTVFGDWLKKHKIHAVEEEFAAEQFEILLNFLKKNNFEQYEISNFARKNLYAKHNSNYWKNEPYLGLGPSAHSFNLYSRQFNVANNSQYIKAISQNTIPCELEMLSPTEQVNEYIMTSIRTIWGCDLNKIKEKFGIDLLQVRQKFVYELIEKKLIRLENRILYLSDKGKLLADKIIEELFILK